MTVSNNSNAPQTEFFDIPLKYLSLALFVLQSLSNLSTTANLVFSPVRYMYKLTSSFSLNLLVSWERLRTITTILSSDMLFKFCAKNCLHKSFFAEVG